MELKLKRTNIKKITIEGKTFTMDCNDISVINAFDEFTKKQSTFTSISRQVLVDDCKEVLETACPGMWDELFTEDENSMAPYYLCCELKNVVLNEFMKDEKERQGMAEEEAMENLEKITSSMTNLTNAMEKANNKYGGNNAMVNKGKSSKKRRHR